jgi:hypothetical protein
MCQHGGFETQTTQTNHLHLATTRPPWYRRVYGLRQASDASVPLDSTDAVFIHPCTLAFQCTMWIARKSVPRLDFSSPSVQTYSRLSFTTLGSSAQTFCLTFTAPVDRHVISYAYTSRAKRHQIHTTLSITNHPCLTTSSPIKIMKAETDQLLSPSFFLK